VIQAFAIAQLRRHLLDHVVGAQTAERILPAGRHTRIQSEPVAAMTAPMTTAPRKGRR
jgi:hypothetical protein